MGYLGLRNTGRFDAVYLLIPIPKWRISGSATGRWMQKFAYTHHRQTKVSLMPISTKKWITL